MELSADKLRWLADAVEAGNYGWNTIASMFEAAGIGLPLSQIAATAYSGDVNAALEMAKALLPGWDWSLHGTGQATLWPPGTVDEQSSGAIEIDIEGKPARALLLALLRALEQLHHGSTDA